MGHIVMTCGAQQSLDAGTMIRSLIRHNKGDWGDVCEEDRQLNDDALQNGSRLLSVYHDEKRGGEKFYIITEWDRSVTTVLLPEEY